MRSITQSWKLGVIATLSLALIAGGALAQGRGEGRRDGGGRGGGGGQRGGGGGGGGAAQRGGGGGGGNVQRGGGDQSRGRAQNPQQRGRSGGEVRRNDGGNRGNSGARQLEGGNRGGQRLEGGNRGVQRPENAERRDNRGRQPAEAPRVREQPRNADQLTPRGADRQERRTNRPDFDGNRRDGGVREPNLGDRNLRDRDGRDRNLGDRNIGDRDGRDRDRGDRNLGDRDGRDRDLRDRDGRNRNLGDRDFFRDGRRGDRDGDRFGDRGDGRRGDRGWDRDWDRDGRDRNGWVNSGWNGRWGRRHDGWRRGFWGWNDYGYRPWWGGYGGWGRTGLGVSLIGLGLGYNSWGWGGYGYPYGYGYGNNWGYGGWLNSSYFYNPYYTTPLTIGTTVVDYSQPLVTVTAYDDSAVVSDDLQDDDPNTLAAMADFDAARISFRAGDYNAALDQVHRAIERLPNDPALHEFRALVLFAQGNYTDAAATLHAVLASGPGWDWATMRDLYPDIDTYTRQLRALEDYARVNQGSADAQFVLGYHYLTEGYQDAGIERFRRVVELEPRDLVATRIVESAVTDAQTTAAEGGDPIIDAPPEAPAAVAGSGPAISIDQLRGDWQATQEDGSSFNLSLAANDTFTWKFAQGDQSNSLQGKYSVSNDLLILEPDTGTPMVARISDVGSDGFRFRMAGTPEEDAGLKFSK